MSEQSCGCHLTIVKLAVTIMLIVTLPVLGCGGNGGNSEEAYVAEATDSLPGETAQDWATFSDHVAIVTPVAERQAESEFVEPGESLAGRNLTLKIDSVLWTREGAPSLPKRISFAQGGWITKDGTRHNFDTGGSPRMEIGHTYIIPLVLFPSGKWGPLTSSSIFSYEGSRIGNGTKVVGARDPSWLDQFAGEDANSAVRLLSSTPPYPGAKDLMNLDPGRRYQAMLDMGFSRLRE